MKSLTELLDHRTDEQKAEAGNAAALALLTRKFEEQERANGAE